MNIYDTTALVGVVPNLLTSQNFLLDRFFPNVINYNTEEVAIDVDVGQRRMAPFCSPLVESELVESRPYQTNKFKPPYIKPKTAPDLRKPLMRQIGERIGGEYTAAEREMINIQFEMADHIDIINRRLEWQAANALISGTITVTGKGYPTTLINYGRSAALSVVLSGGSLWPTSLAVGATNNVPSLNIEQWQTQVLQSSGAVCTDIIFTTSSWAAFKLDTTLRDNAIILPQQSPFGNRIDAGPRISKGAVLKGYWGQYTLWLYNDWYIDPLTGIETPMIPDGMVIMSGPDMMGVRAFGVILDPAFNYGPMSYAPKTWVEQDPPQRYIMTQSAGLVVPSRVNASLSAMVV